jgi:AraC-like DNA-binding protein
MMSPALRPVPDAAAAIDRHVWRGDLVAIGAFRCDPRHPLFEDSGPIQNHCVVFPRSSLVIEPAGFRPFVGDPGVVSVYNAGQEYRRRPISPAGDRCDYFAVTDEALRGVVEPIDPDAAGRRDVFRVSHVVGRARWYATQRQIVKAALDPAGPDPLEAEERVLRLIDDVAAAIAAARRRQTATDSAGTRRRRDLVDAARRVLARRACERLTLRQLASAVGASPFHMCRAFREVTGTTLHRFREQLRLAAALELIEEGHDLSRVALDVGYSSHSHLAAAFRRAYGHSPSGARAFGRRPG